MKISFNLLQLHDHSLKYESLETVCVNEKKGSKNIILATYYRPPVDSLYENIINVFISQVNTLNRCSNNLIICDEFKFDFFKINSDSKVFSLYDTTSAYLSTHLSTLPTIITNRSQTHIDFFFVFKPYRTVAGILTFDVSDHFPILAVFNIFLTW